MALSSTSSTRTRASNLTGLIDIDALVEAQTLRQKNRINTQTQNLKIEQYKQLMYQEIQGKAHKMYQKYCDILSSNNGLFGLDTSGYKAVKFSSSNSNAVTATADSTAKAINYKVEVTQLAETAKYSVVNENGNLDEGKVLAINQGAKTANFVLSGNNVKDRISNLNKQLKEQGFDLKANYSDFINNGTGGLLIESGKTGSNVSFSVGSATSECKTAEGNSGTCKSTIKQDVSGLTAGGIITINGQNIELRGTTTDEILNNLKSDMSANTELNGKVNLIVSIDSNDSAKKNIKFEAVNPGNGENLNIRMPGESSELNIEINGADPSYAEINTGWTLSSLANQTLKFGNKTISDVTSISDLNNKLANEGINITASEDSGTIKFTANEVGTVGNFSVYKYSTTSAMTTYTGQNSAYKITDLSTNNVFDTSNLTNSDEISKYCSSNEVTLDGVTFNFSSKTDAGNEVTLTGKLDGSDITDKIVDFINDYNELLGNINTKLYEKYDKSYKPLTDDDKEGLTDSQITKLEEKAKVGLLQNDDTLTEFASALKEVMTTISSGGQSVERLGFKAVNNYKAENGLFTVPSDTSAIAKNIANNIDDVKELFAGENGIFKKLGDVFKKYSSGSSGVTPQSSVLGKLAGITNGSYNDITTMGKDIKERKLKLAELQAALTEKENNLYTKYSTLESNLSKLQSQQSSLSSYFS